MKSTSAIRRLGYSNMIVGLSGNAFDEDVNNFLIAGVDLCLIKPINYDIIKNLLIFYQNFNGKFCSKNDVKFKIDKSLNFVNNNKFSN